MPRHFRTVLSLFALFWSAIALFYAGPTQASSRYYYGAPQGYVVYDGYADRYYAPAPRLAAPKMKRARHATPRRIVLRDGRVITTRATAIRPGYERRALSPRAKARIEARRKAQRLARLQNNRIASTEIPRLGPQIDLAEPRLGARAVPRVATLGDVPTRRQLQPTGASNVEARVDIASQRMIVSVDGEVRHVWKVSTGRKGFSTPRGAYKPQRMHVSYFSRKYYNSPMPYSIFFRGGYAVHGTTAINRLGGPASHGCVRLATSNARILFQLVKSAGPSRTRIVIG